MISVVVPVYNNGATVGELARRVGAALRPQAYEIIFQPPGWRAAIRLELRERVVRASVSTKMIS